jgi:hypothetical protein
VEKGYGETGYRYVGGKQRRAIRIDRRVMDWCVVRMRVIAELYLWLLEECSE